MNFLFAYSLKTTKKMIISVLYTCQLPKDNVQGSFSALLSFIGAVEASPLGSRLFGAFCAGFVSPGKSRDIYSLAAWDRELEI